MASTKASNNLCLRTLSIFMTSLSVVNVQSICVLSMFFLCQSTDSYPEGNKTENLQYIMFSNSFTWLIFLYLFLIYMYKSCTIKSYYKSSYYKLLSLMYNCLYMHNLQSSMLPWKNIWEMFELYVQIICWLMYKYPTLQ